MKILSEDTDKFQINLDDNCSVCLMEFAMGDKYIVIPDCNHIYHSECLKLWLKENNNCPICR